MPRFIPVLLAAVLAAPALAAPPPADPVAAGLQAAAPQLLAHLKANKAANVGVLKFLVRHGDRPARDDAGDLNIALANKLELALVLANTDDAFGVLREPSAAVVRDHVAGANHLDADGRRAFFDRKFELNWTDDKVTPAAFVVGEMTIADDLSTLTVALRTFDKSGDLADAPGGFTGPADPKALADAGFGFTLPVSITAAIASGKPPARADIVKAAVAAAKPLPASAPAPAPAVAWAVLYNGKEVVPQDGRVPEPTEADRVEFRLTNPGPGTFAVVVLVNGESTIGRERAAPNDCRKWVLPPKASVTIGGFQADDGTRTRFSVLAAAESDAGAVNYAAHAGTFRAVVYAGTETDAAPDGPADAAPADRELLALARTRGTAAPAGVKPQSLKALQATLRGRDGAADGARGLVAAAGPAEAAAVKRVYFKAATDVPVSDVTLRYYTPKAEK